MSPTFVLERPEWLAGAVAAAALLISALRARSFWAALLRVLLIVPLLTGAALLLTQSGTPRALLALCVLAAVVCAGLAVQVYRALPRELSPLQRVVCAVLRWSAWCALLLMLARPTWTTTTEQWEKPVLPVLIDQSASMGLADAARAGSPALSRAERVRAAIEQSRKAIATLNERYDVRLLAVGGRPEPLPRWQLEPAQPLTAIASALRYAAEQRGPGQASVGAIIVISDGAENVFDARAVRAAGTELSTGGTAIYAVGVGPAPGELPEVELEPLAVPPRLGLRDRLRIPVVARVRGARGAEVGISLLWDDDPVGRRGVSIDAAYQRAEEVFDTTPPGVGVHRLTAVAALPGNLGGHVFETSAIVEVVEDRIRVLYVESTPRPESGFVLRAWQGDSNLEVSRVFLFGGAGGAESFDADTGLWFGYDVVVLGALSRRLPDALLRALGEAVSERGVGLLIAGGRALLESSDYRQTPLELVAPVALGAAPRSATTPVRFLPTEAGLRHAVFLSDTGPAATREAWEALPPIAPPAALGELKPASEVLAADADGAPLLVAHEVGRGRCLAAAWDATWPWALASDSGLQLHRRFWRQIVAWLANRQPRAWVLSDQPSYPRAALAEGQRRILIRAGLSGPTPPVRPGAPALEATLRLQRKGSTQPGALLPLERRDGDWFVELPNPALPDPPASGEYELVFTMLERESGESARAAPPLVARSGFRVTETSVELRPPTANLTLLRAVAEATAENGGRYVAITELPKLIAELGARDQRRRVELSERYPLVRENAWALLGVAALCMALEWGVRKRAGLN